MAQHEPTEQKRKQVEAMAAYGIPSEDIARVVGIDPKTLRKYYRDELDLGMTKANAKVAESLYQNAVNGNVTAQIFWCKTRMGWRDTNPDADIGKKAQRQAKAEQNATEGRFAVPPMPPKAVVTH